MRLQQLEALAPPDLPNRRNRRYHGGGSSVMLDRLEASDRDRAVLLYQAIQQIGCFAGRDIAAALPDLKARIAAFSVTPLKAAAFAFGRSSMKSDGELARVVHDVRGGAMNALVGYSDLDLDIDDVQACVLVARDHAKMMRNAFPDIDPELRAHDESVNLHALDDYLAPWNGRLIRQEGRRVRVRVENHFSGYFSDRCLETSAVDRVLYNLANNAARFSASDTIALTTFLTGPGVVRWVMANPVTADQVEWLKANVGSDLGVLFEGGKTRGGNGIGLSSCARFTADAFGLISSEEAVRDGYLGAALLDDNVFCCWFHWPSYEAVGDEVVCGCHG